MFDKFTIHILFLIGLLWIFAGDLICAFIIYQLIVFSTYLSTHCMARPLSKSFNVKEKCDIYRQLQLLRNIINEEMFGIEFLWCIILAQIVVALIIFFNEKLYPLIRNEYYLIAVGIAATISALSIVVGTEKVFKLVSSVTKSSLNWKIQAVQLKLTPYETRLLKSCSPLNFNVARCLKFSSVASFKILHNSTLDLAVAMLKAYR